MEYGLGSFPPGEMCPENLKVIGFVSNSFETPRNSRAFVLLGQQVRPKDVSAGSETSVPALSALQSPFLTPPSQQPARHQASRHPQARPCRLLDALGSSLA